MLKLDNLISVLLHCDKEKGRYKDMIKSRIGARKLEAEEVRLILPTYDQIYIQIDQFRSGKSIDGNQKKKNRDIDQKTNNIGIIGVRGAGKTSVLKTIRTELQEHQKENNDIVLPIVVPENMSESSTLMATILGMLSDEVNEIDKEQPEGENKECIGKSDLRSCCDDVIRQYTYIQKEYRDILIHEYTTDNQYVSSSAKVFNSDTEFLYKFNQLVGKLMKKSGKEKGLLFVFIDDIDLSTYRCADVVKTLLSYLSNENIVTLISGDLETFEEALTLDFLRQEKVLEKNILGEKIGNKPILNSKKLLAYEYLKKILPPVYRHNIKNWSLEERANYIIGKEKEKGKRLSDLLEEALEDWIDPAFFCYTSTDTNTGTKVKMPLPYTYLLFDSTSRGLNNVYNVLSDIARERKQYKEGQNEKDENSEKKKVQRELEQKKILLDTIVSSKAVYNNYREQILKRMFAIGIDLDSSKVFFDNACSIIYKEILPVQVWGKANEKEKDTAQKKKMRNTYEIGNAEERFALYLLVDFAARLLYEKGYGKLTEENEYFIILKNKAMEDFFFHPEVAEKVLDTGDKGWEDKEMINLSKIDFKDLSLGRLNQCFLLKGDLTLNLAYYKNLPLEKVLELYQDSDAEKQTGAIKRDDMELRQSIIIAFWKALESVAETNGVKPSDKVVEYYPVYTMEFLYIRDQLSGSKIQNEVMRLFDRLWDEVYKDERGNNGTLITWKEQQKEQQIKRVMMNTIAQYLKKDSEDSVKEKWEEFATDEILDEDGNSIPEEILKKRIAFLKAIDSGKLWGETTAEAAVAYLESEIVRYLNKIKKCMYRDGDYANILMISELEKKERLWGQMPRDGWKLNTNAAVDDWKNFYESEDGVSYTKSKQTKNAVSKNLAKHSFNEGMPYAIYDEIIRELRKLATNYQVWYGRAESQQMLDSLQLSYAVPNPTQDTSSNQDPKDKWYNEPYFIFLLQCYYKYKRFVGNGEGIARDASLLTKIAQVLSEAYSESDHQIMNTFIDKLNKELSREAGNEKTNIEEFEEIFAEMKKGSRQ